MALPTSSELAKPKGTSGAELPACPAGFDQKSLDVPHMHEGLQQCESSGRRRDKKRLLG
jgi:hypothetical protein